MLDDFMRKHSLGKDFSATAQKWYIPLAEQIRTHQLGAKAPLFIGINGCQGSGKSTLSSFLSDYLTSEYQLNVVNLSLDDFYLSKSKRFALSIKIHPMFETRGVPGTHDTELLHSVLDRIKHNKGNVQLPRFDKSNDNPFPKNEWLEVKTPVDIVILEGWCWGVTAQSDTALSSPINQLEQQNDELGIWRNFANRQLTEHYVPLYAFMNMWLMLKAPSFSNVYQWRLEQEQKLQLKSQGQTATSLMNEEQIKQFIQYYQRLTEHSLATLPADCDVVFELDGQRNIIKQISKE